MISLGLDQVQIDTAIPLMAGVRIARFRDLDARDLAGWARLSDQCGADSVFGSDWFVGAVLTHFDPDGAHRICIATDALGECYGVAVLTPAARLGRVPLAHWRGLANPNRFLGVPLVRSGREAAFWRGMFAALDWQGLGQAALCLADMPADHRVTRALLAQAGAEGRMVEVLARHDRAALLPSADAALPLDAGLSSKRLARLRSLDRKLERDHGAASCHRLGPDDDIDAWIDAFLALEAAGWKGRAGSALASAPGSAALFRDVVRSAHARGAIACLALDVGGRTIAMSSFFLANGHGFGFKCCFDEGFASYAPGILLLRRIMAMADRLGITQFDSCSAATEATINGLWPQRRELLDIAVALHAPLAELRFDSAMRARQAWHWWKARRATSLATA